MMSEAILKQQIYQTIETLPAERLVALLQWLTTQPVPKVAKKRRVRGRLKGLSVMHPDFDEPLDDFKEYMSFSFGT